MGRGRGAQQGKGQDKARLPENTKQTSRFYCKELGKIKVLTGYERVSILFLLRLDCRINHLIN